MAATAVHSERGEAARPKISAAGFIDYPILAALRDGRRFLNIQVNPGAQVRHGESVLCRTGSCLLFPRGLDDLGEAARIETCSADERRRCRLGA